MGVIEAIEEEECSSSYPIKKSRLMETDCLLFAVECKQDKSVEKNKQKYCLGRCCNNGGLKNCTSN